MKPYLLLTIVASLALSAFTPHTIAANSGTGAPKGGGSAPKGGGKGGKSKKAEPTPVPEKAKAFAEIKSVSGDSITIEHSKTTTTYKMSTETQIQIDGNRASAKNLKPGMHVEVTPSSINPTVLRSVAATTPTKG